MTKIAKLSKLPKKLRIDKELLGFIGIVAAKGSMSISECIETMLLLVKCVYDHDKDEEIAFILRELKCKQIMGLKSLKANPPSTLCHVTLHPDALEFARCLHEAYPPIIDSSTEAISLCVRYCEQFYRNGSGLDYLCGRLASVRELRR